MNMGYAVSEREGQNLSEYVSRRDAASSNNLQEETFERTAWKENLIEAQRERTSGSYHCFGAWYLTVVSSIFSREAGKGFDILRRLKERSGACATPLGHNSSVERYGLLSPQRIIECGD